MGENTEIKKHDKVRYYFLKEFGIEVVHLKNMDFLYSEHSHCSVFVIGVVLKGSIRLNLEKEKFKYEESSFFVIQPYKLHSLRSVSKDKDCELLTVCVKKEIVQNSGIKVLKNFLTQVFCCFLDKKFRETIDRKKIHKAIEYMYSYKNANYFSTCDMKKLEDYIKNSMEEDINLDKLSEYIYVSKYHMIREFKKSTGLSPHRFLIQNRVRKAQKLINKGINLGEVAVITGFYDQSHFIKSFKNIVRLTPLAYKTASIDNLKLNREQEKILQKYKVLLKMH